MPKSNTACVLDGVSWYELQSYLWMVATCAAFAGAWEKLSCELRLADASAALGDP